MDPWLLQILVAIRQGVKKKKINTCVSEYIGRHFRIIISIAFFFSWQKMCFFILVTMTLVDEGSAGNNSAGQTKSHNQNLC